MGMREKLGEKPIAAIAGAASLVVLAGIIIAHSYWPEKKADLSSQYYSDDDGQTWFADSTYLVPPFEHNGKTAVIAAVFSYDDGKKQFCAYLAKFTPEAKQQLESALAEAKVAGKPPGSVSLYRDPRFMSQGMLAKRPGAGNPWISYGDPRSSEVLSPHSPDGSVVDQCLVY